MFGDLPLRDLLSWLGVDRTVLVLDTMTEEGVEGGAVGLVKRLGAG